MPDVHHIHIIGRYGQGQTTLMTSRSQGQSQGHQGHFRFAADLHHIHIIGGYAQGQSTYPDSSGSQGRSQGHEGHCRFLPILYVFANFSYSFDRRVLKTHRYVLSDHTQKRSLAEF